MSEKSACRLHPIPLAIGVIGGNVIGVAVGWNEVWAAELHCSWAVCVVLGWVWGRRWDR